MSSSKTGAAAVDEARTEMCRRFAGLMNAGSYQVRVRLPLADGKPSEAWFYGHRDNTWHKESDIIKNAALVAAIAEEVDLLASKKHSDDWSVRQNSARDWKEIEIKFQREPLAEHLGNKLASFLLGLLFHDPHDSKKDRREQVRRGPLPQGRSHP